jgi:virulence-associated protein VapD
VSQVSVTKENCKNIIGGNSAYFSEHYAILDGLEEKRAACTDKFLKVSVKDVNFFDVENNFKSAFAVDFSMPFYTDK